MAKTKKAMWYKLYLKKKFDRAYRLTFGSKSLKECEKECKKRRLQGSFTIIAVMKDDNSPQGFRHTVVKRIEDISAKSGNLSVERGLIGSGPVMTLKQGVKSIDVKTLEEGRWLRDELGRFIIAHKNQTARKKK
jgi:hypothetical protein